jgi:hypothetical protein
MAMKTKNAGTAGNKNRSNKIPLSLADKKGASGARAVSKSKDTIAAPGGTDPAYLALISRLPLRPIRTDDELDAATAMIDNLTGRDDRSLAEAD